jgi:hypothetical protein
MVAKQRLASGSSTNRQRCSAGWSSGLYDALVVAGAHRSGKIDEDEFEQLLADGVGLLDHLVGGSQQRFRDREAQ